MSGASTAPVASVDPIARIALRRRSSARHVLAMAAAGLGVVVLAWAVAWLLALGVGVWGNNQPHVWGLDLIAYAWWIGVANAASLFAASLVLRRHGLRTAVNRFAEAAALAAILVAAIYPVLHLGRPLLAHWVFPLPTTVGVWPYFGGALIWDFWGIVSHIVVTSLFWFIGLIPDLATLRDRAARAGRIGVARAYGVFALGWRGSLAHWHRHQAAYRLVAALVLPLLLFAQTVVAMEFVATPVPGWHSARLPLHMLGTGLPSGLGVVIALAALLRWSLDVEPWVDDADMDLLSRLLASAGAACLMLYAYDLFSGLVLADAPVRAAYAGRVSAPAYWWALFLSAVLPQLLWVRRLRVPAWSVIPVGLLASAGVWLDRWSLVVDALQRGGHGYAPSGNEWQLFVGGAGLFAITLLLFARRVPVVAMFEIRHEETEREREEAER